MTFLQDAGANNDRFKSLTIKRFLTTTNPNCLGVIYLSLKNLVDEILNFNLIILLN